MNISPELEAKHTRINEQLQRLRRDERVRTWLLVEQLGAILLAEDHSTGWVDVRALTKIAKKHRINCAGVALTIDDLGSMLRNTLDRKTTVQMVDVAVDYTEMPKGRTTIPALKFTRVFSEPTRNPAETLPTQKAA